MQKLLKHCFEVFAVSHAMPGELQAEYLLIIERVLSVPEYVQNVISLESGNNLWNIFVQQLERLAIELEKLMQISELKRPPPDKAINLYRNIGRLIRLFISGVDFSLGNDQFTTLLFKECSRWLDVEHHSFRKSHACNLALEDIDAEIFQTLNGYVAHKGKEAIPFLRLHASPIIKHCFQSSFTFGQHSRKLCESFRFLRSVLLAASDWAAGYGFKRCLMVEDMNLVCFKQLTRAVFNFPHLDTLQKTAPESYADYLALAADVLHFGLYNEVSKPYTEEVMQKLLQLEKSGRSTRVNFRSLRHQSIRLHILHSICRQHPAQGPHMRTVETLQKMLLMLKEALQKPCDMMILRRGFENEFEQHECVWAARCLIPLTFSTSRFSSSLNHNTGAQKAGQSMDGMPKGLLAVWGDIERFLLKNMLPSLLFLDSTKQNQGFTNDAVNSTALITTSWLVTSMLSTGLISAQGKRAIIQIAKDIIAVFSPTLSSVPTSFNSREEVVNGLTTRVEAPGQATHIPFHLFRFVSIALAKCRKDVDHPLSSVATHSTAMGQSEEEVEPLSKRQRASKAICGIWDSFHVRSVCWLLDWLQHCVLTQDQRYHMLVCGLVGVFQPAQVSEVGELSMEERFDLDEHALLPKFYDHAVDTSVIEKLTAIRPLRKKRIEQEGKAEQGFVPLFQSLYASGECERPTAGPDDDLAALTRDEEVLLQTLLLDSMAQACKVERVQGQVPLFLCFLRVLTHLNIHATLAPKLQNIVKRMVEVLRRLAQDHHLETTRSPVPFDTYLDCCQMLITLVSAQTGDTVALVELLGTETSALLTDRVVDRLLERCKRTAAAVRQKHSAPSAAKRSDGFDDFFAAENLGRPKEESAGAGFDAGATKSPQKLHPFRAVAKAEGRKAGGGGEVGVGALVRYLEMVYGGRKFAEKIVEVFEVALDSWRKDTLNIQVLFDLCEGLFLRVAKREEEVLKASLEMLTAIAKLDDSHVRIPYLVVKQLLHALVCLDQAGNSSQHTKLALLEHLDWILGSKLLIQMKKSRYSIRDRYRAIGGWFYSTRLRVDILLLVGSCFSLFEDMEEDKAVNMNTYCLRVIEGSITDSNIVVREVASILFSCLSLDPSDLRAEVEEALAKFQRPAINESGGFDPKTFAQAREFVRTEMLVLCEVARHDRALLRPVLLRLCYHTAGSSRATIQHQPVENEAAENVALAGDKAALFTLAQALTWQLASCLGFSSSEALLESYAVEVLALWLEGEGEGKQSKTLGEFPHELFAQSKSQRAFYTSRLVWLLPAIALHPRSSPILRDLQDTLGWSSRQLQRELLNNSAAVFPFTLLEGTKGESVKQFCADHLPGLEAQIDKEAAICNLLDLLATSSLPIADAEEVDAWVAALVGTEGASSINVLIIVQHLAQRIMRGTCHARRSAYIRQLERLIGWIGEDVKDLGVCYVLVKTLLRAIRRFHSIKPAAGRLLGELGRTVRGSPAGSVLVGGVVFVLTQMKDQSLDQDEVKDDACERALRSWERGRGSAPVEQPAEKLEEVVASLLRAYEIPFLEGEVSLVKSCYLLVLSPLLHVPLCLQRLDDLNRTLSSEALADMAAPAVQALGACLIELTSIDASEEVQKAASRALGNLGSCRHGNVPTAAGRSSQFCELQVSGLGGLDGGRKSGLPAVECQRFSADLAEDERLPRLLHATPSSTERMKLLQAEVMQGEDECRAPVEEPAARFLLPGKLVLLDYACNLLFSERLLLVKAVAPLMLQVLRSREGRFCAHFLSTFQQSLIARFATQAWARQDAKPPSPDPLFTEAVDLAKESCGITGTDESVWDEDRLISVSSDMDRLC